MKAKAMGSVLGSNDAISVGLLIAIMSVLAALSSYFLTRRQSEVAESEMRRSQIKEIAQSICEKIRLETISAMEARIKEVEISTKAALEFSKEANREIRIIEESVNNIKLQNAKIESMLMTMKEMLLELKACIATTQKQVKSESKD